LTLHGPPKAIPSTPAGVTPFSDEEKAVVDDVDSIYMENDQFNPNESALAVGEMNNVIEHHPHSAYAELYMSNYYRQRGQAALAQTWLDRSLSDAPTILAGRVVNDRGLPVCNCGLIFSMEANWLWDCPPEQNGQKSTELRYDPVTDANGCFYIPVFPCRLTGVCTAWPCVGESPNALSTCFDGWVFPNRGFLVRGKIGIVKPIVMRRRVQLSLGGTFATGDYASLGNQRNPVSLNGKSMTISWKSCPNATSYVLNFQERGSDGNDDSGPVNTIRVTRLANRAPENELQSFELSLVGKPPFILSHRLYSVEIEARHSLSGVRDPEPALLNESQPIYFIAPGAPESLPITKDRIEAAAGSGSTVESIALNDGEATVVTRSMEGLTFGDQATGPPGIYSDIRT
jgi:hypothetical protein